MRSARSALALVLVWSAVEGRAGATVCADGVPLAVGPTSYLNEGGLIEAVLPGGRMFCLARYHGGDVELLLPPTRGPVELTPIAIDGQRGPTTKVAARDIPQEAVYISCKVARGSSSRGLWLLAPLVWIYARSRRRRGSA